LNGTAATQVLSATIVGRTVMDAVGTVK